MSKAKQKTRIYSVARKGHGTTRLVEANNWAQALRHVARDEYQVDVAGQKQIVEAVKRGVAVEEASPEPVDPPVQQVLPQAAAEPGLATGEQGA